MNIFLAGATGAVGRSLIPLLTATATPSRAPPAARRRPTRCARSAPSRSCVDGLDRAAVLDAVAAAQPDAIVNQMTALSGLSTCASSSARSPSPTACAPRAPSTCSPRPAATGVERVIVQSYAGWPYARTGGPVKTEDDPLDPDPPKQMRTTLDAIRRQEELVTAAGGVALRYGGFYGPGTGLAPGGEQWEAVRRASSRSSATAAACGRSPTSRTRRPATLAALEHWTPGEVYNVVDDEPAPVREWLPARRRRDRRTAAAQGPALGRAADGRARGRADVRGPRRVQREGARASSDGRRSGRPGARASRRWALPARQLEQLEDRVPVARRRGDAELLVGEQLRQRRALDAVRGATRRSRGR